MGQATHHTLMAALPHIMAAPKDASPIEMLCFRPDYRKRNFVDRLSVSVTGGIEGERWSKAPWLKLPDGRPDPSIQICFLSKRVLDVVWTDRENVIHPGDTFIVDMDLSEHNLPVGQRLQAGSAVIEVSSTFNDACVKWKARYGAAAKDWVNMAEHAPLRLRGILARVVQDGELTLNAPLAKL